MARRQAVYRQGRAVHLGSADRQIRRRNCASNPRKIWYPNLDQITTNGGYEVTFHLKRPQPAFIAHSRLGHVAGLPVTSRRKRCAAVHPIGTGPFKFVEFKPNESIRLTRNPDYWKSGLPLLDGIEYTIAKNRSTVILAFIAGKYDLTFAGSVTVPLMRDIQTQMPSAICELPPLCVSTNLIVNCTAPPSDNPELRRVRRWRSTARPLSIS